MIQKKKVLILPAGTELGLELHECLALSKYWEIFGANSLRDQSEVAYHNIEFGMPFATAPGFADFVHKLVEKIEPDFIFPAHDDVIYELSKVPLPHGVLVGPTQELAAVLRFKSSTYKALHEVVPCPQPADLRNRGSIQFPIFSKPDRGQGSRGARRINSVAELESSPMDGQLYLEYLPGDEFTVDCYTDQQGKLLFSSARKRTRVNNGISVRADEISDTRFSDIAKLILSVLPLRGVWFFQVKESNSGELTLLEIANRVSGTMGYQRERGINLPEAWLHELSGRSVNFMPWAFGPIIYDRSLNARVKWDFRPDTVYVDLDDTLILPNGKLHYRLVGNLFGLKINLGSRIVLLTRHRGALETTLPRYNLSGLFDEVRHLQDGQLKSTAIDASNALFIDDSFSERSDVFEKHKIPTFSVESLACLEGINHTALG